MIYKLVSWLCSAIFLTRSNTKTAPPLITLLGIVYLIFNPSSLRYVVTTCVLSGVFLLTRNCFGRLIIVVALSNFLVLQGLITEIFAILYISGAFSIFFHQQGEK